jgi:hypothetical protein
MLDGPTGAAPTPTAIAPMPEPGSPPHDHSPVLVELDFGVAGRAIREYACRGCASVWFE